MKIEAYYRLDRNSIVPNDLKSIVKKIASDKKIRSIPVRSAYGKESLRVELASFFPAEKHMFFYYRVCVICHHLPEH